MRPHTTQFLLSALIGLLLPVFPIWAQTSTPSLEAVQSWELEEGTHRPEILLSEDGKEIILVVVHPKILNDGTLVKHQVHFFDVETGEKSRDSFDIAWETEEYGEPADHRALLIDGELVVVYQTNIAEEGTVPTEGPAEDHSKEQSLLLARFTLEGEELLRQPIVAHVTDFTEDNFPDFCILWYRNRLYVSTGTRGDMLKIREVDLDAKVLEEHRLETSTEAINGNIGNSLAVHENRLFLYSYAAPGEGILTRTELDPETCEPLETQSYSTEERERLFPVGNLRIGDHQFVGHISRSLGGGGLEENPYHPYLLLLDAEGNEVLDLEVGGEGMAHVHPTLVKIGNRLLVAWSQQVEPDNSSETGPQDTPQVVVQEYRLTGFSEDEPAEEEEEIESGSETDSGEKSQPKENPSPKEKQVDHSKRPRFPRPEQGKRPHGHKPPFRGRHPRPFHR